MSKIYLDFESRSRVDIWQVGAYAYSIHPSTEVLCLAYAIDNAPVEILRKEDLGLVSPFEISKKEIFYSFNALFEQCIWNNIMAKKWGWPRIPIRQWRCIMAKSLASAYPQSLANACNAIDSPYKKSVTGHTLMLKMSKPNIKGAWNEQKEDFEKLYQYCIDDVMAERSLDQMLPDLNPAEQTIWFLDQLINQRGIHIDREAVSKALSFIAEYSERLNKIVFKQSGGVLSGITRRQAVLDWCKTQGVDITDYTKGNVSKILEGTLPENVRTVLETKLELGKTSVAKYESLHNATTADGRLRDTLIYHGATTGRWTGKLFQLHNLPKGTVVDTESAISCLKKYPLEDFEILYPDVMGTLSSCIRGMIIASPGTNLFVGDFNAIEARVVMWLAGEKFIDGIYEDMARRIYNKREITKKERELGKAVILGCGFGMGVKKFMATCETRGAPVDEVLATLAVNTYRETYSKVKEMWYDQENAAINVVKNPFAVSVKWAPSTTLWFMEGKNLKLKLPSGRCLTYPQATLEYADTPWGDRKLTLCFMAVDSKNRWSKEKTYGGKITENITQAVARDILALAMLRLEKAGYPVIFSVHDEIVCEVPKSEKNITEFRRLLEICPDWATGLSIKAECWQGKRYKKG